MSEVFSEVGFRPDVMDLLERVCVCVCAKFTQVLRFLAKNTSLSTIAGFKEEHWQVTMLPLVLKSLSEGELVAGMQRYLRASLAKRGKFTWCILHQVSGSSSLSMEGVSR